MLILVQGSDKKFIISQSHFKSRNLQEVYPCFQRHTWFKKIKRMVTKFLGQVRKISIVIVQLYDDALMQSLDS